VLALKSESNVKHRSWRVTKKLDRQEAVITGGTEGIGLATAKRFVEEGAYVCITGRRQKHLDVAVKAIGANVSGVSGRHCRWLTLIVCTRPSLR